MVNVEKFPNAYKEVYKILKLIPQEDLDKIPKDFMDMIEKDMNDEYIFSIDNIVDFEEIRINERNKNTFILCIFKLLGN